jgi:hypothetical protein
MRKVKSQAIFWKMLDENVQAVQEFYLQQLTSMRSQFHMLAIEAIKLVRDFDN